MTVERSFNYNAIKVERLFNCSTEQLQHILNIKERIKMKKSFRLVGLDCANCAAKMERAIARLPGVEKVTVSFMTTKMTIEAADDKMDEIVKEATAIVKKYEPDVEVKRA